jgi:hypothetical protein
MLHHMKLFDGRWLSLTLGWKTADAPHGGVQTTATDVVTQLVKKFPDFYGSWRFITVFTRVCHYSLCLARCIQSTGRSWHTLLIPWTNFCVIAFYLHFRDAVLSWQLPWTRLLQYHYAVWVQTIIALWFIICLTNKKCFDLGGDCV